MCRRTKATATPGTVACGGGRLWSGPQRHRKRSPAGREWRAAAGGGQDPPACGGRGALGCAPASLGGRMRKRRGAAGVMGRDPGAQPQPRGAPPRRAGTARERFAGRSRRWLRASEGRFGLGGSIPRPPRGTRGRRHGRTWAGRGRWGRRGVGLGPAAAGTPGRRGAPARWGRAAAVPVGVTAGASVAAGAARAPTVGVRGARGALRGQPSGGRWRRGGTPFAGLRLPGRPPPAGVPAPQGSRRAPAGRKRRLWRRPASSGYPGRGAATYGPGEAAPDPPPLPDAPAAGRPQPAALAPGPRGAPRTTPRARPPRRPPDAGRAGAPLRAVVGEAGTLRPQGRGVGGQGPAAAVPRTRGGRLRGAGGPPWGRGARGGGVRARRLRARRGLLGPALRPPRGAVGCPRPVEAGPSAASRAVAARQPHPAGVAAHVGWLRAGAGRERGLRHPASSGSPRRGAASVGPGQAAAPSAAAARSLGAQAPPARRPRPWVPRGPGAPPSAAAALPAPGPTELPGPA